MPQDEGGTPNADAMGHLQAASLVGQVLDGRYKITRKLGEGGMGEVYAADHVHIEKRFAIKLLRPEIVSNPEAVSRFRQEARSSSSIGHRNIIAIEDFGTLSDGRIYMCMELLNGAALNDLIMTPQPVERLLNILIQTGHGLAAAHAKNIVHRDMKPENIFVTIGANNEDVPKLLDFGIAKVAGNDGQNNLTRTGTIFGTPFYMAPEQALGNPVDARTDIYAVGVIMYEVFSGSLPFQGESFMGILTQHITSEPENVNARCAKTGRVLPPGLADIITRCLQKNPAQRFSSMDELVNALIPIYRGIAGAGMSTYMEAFPGGASARMPAATPMTGAHQVGQVAPTVGVGMTPPGIPGFPGQIPGGSGPSGAVAPHPSDPNVQYQQQYPPPVTPVPVKKKSSAGLLIAIIAVLVVGGGVATAVVLMNDDKKAEPVAATDAGTGTSERDAGSTGPKTVDGGGRPATPDAPPPTQELDAGDGVVDAGSVEPLVDAPPIQPTDIPVKILAKNNDQPIEIYEDGVKIISSVGNSEDIGVKPGTTRTLTIKSAGFKDQTITIDGKRPRVDVRMVRLPPVGCTALSCPAGQSCESGKCRPTAAPTCTATSCPAGQSCDNGTCRVKAVPQLNCTNDILDVKSKACIAQYCRAHPDNPTCDL